MEFVFSLAPKKAHINEVQLVCRESRRRIQPRKPKNTSVGCSTCKARDLKCDGRRPQCYRCLNAGLICDEFAPTQTLKTEILSTNQEKRSLEYFKVNTAPRLSGHYDKEFWRNVVLQVSVSNIPLRHLLAAVGALHESLDLRAQRVPQESQSQLQYQFSLQQCNRAIKLLSDSKRSPPSTTLVLICCVLFVTFENCQNDIETAVQHLSSGLKLLNDWQKSKSPALSSASEDDLVNDHLYPLISRLGNQMEVVSKARGNLSKAVQLRSRLQLSGSHSRKVTSLQQAGRLLEGLLNDIVLAMEAPRSPTSLAGLREIVNRYWLALREWYTNFLRFLQSHPINRDPSFPSEVIILQLRYYTAEIVVTSMAFVDEMLFDEHQQSFRRIVLLCREFHELENGQLNSESGKLNLGFENGIIMPLWMTGFCCRDPVIRREAIDLMYEIKRQEGIWGSEICAIIAAQVMKIEETGLIVSSSADIPASHRIRLLQLDHEPAGFDTSASTTQHDLQLPCFIFTWYRPADTSHHDPIQFQKTRMPFNGFSPIKDSNSRSPSASSSQWESPAQSEELITLHVHDPGDFAWRISFPYDYGHCLTMQWSVAHFAVG